jgi:fluoroacetyl-CoA thioesterase
MTDKKTEAELKPGVKGELELDITDAYTTQRGDYKIFSTPNMVMLLEKAAIEALKPYLTDAQTSVGSRVDVKHLGPTLLGMHARAVATVTEVEGSRVAFQVEIFDEMDKVGEAMHERYILDQQRYFKRLDRKGEAYAAQRPGHAKGIDR